MHFLPDEIDLYAAKHTSKESELLYRLNRQTHLKVLQPRMLSGHVQGRMLSMFSNMIKPEYIVEIGTYTGYSALCLAEGLQEKGKLLTIEIDPEVAEFAKDFIASSDFNEQIEVRVGNAMEIIPTLTDKADLVFIDADKSNYLNYLDTCYDLLKVGGYLLGDNVLWSGKVVHPAPPKDVDTNVLQEFNLRITEDPRFENVLLPLRDGFMVARKIK